MNIDIEESFPLYQTVMLFMEFMKNRIILIAYLFLVSACATDYDYGSKYASSENIPKTEYGYIAIFLSGEYEPNPENRDHASIGVHLFPKGGLLGSGSLHVRQKKGSELILLYAKPGIYEAPWFSWILIEQTLRHRQRINEFEVLPGKVTYIGDYNFRVFLKKSLLGHAIDGFDFKIVNNLESQKVEILKMVRDASGQTLTSTDILNPKMSGW